MGARHSSASWQLPRAVPPHPLTPRLTSRASHPIPPFSSPPRCVCWQETHHRAAAASPTRQPASPHKDLTSSCDRLGLFASTASSTTPFRPPSSVRSPSSGFPLVVTALPSDRSVGGSSRRWRGSALRTTGEGTSFSATAFRSIPFLARRDAFLGGGAFAAVTGRALALLV